MLAREPDVLHLQWLAAPEVDRLAASRPRAPLVFTAHDLLPRRTAPHRALADALRPRSTGIVVHCERGRDALAAFGVARTKLRVIPHPVFPRDVGARTTARTVLALGRDPARTRASADAVEAVLRVDGARLLVAGDPRIPLDALRSRAGDRAEWRLGYLEDGELARALAESHGRASFPIAPSSTSRGALLQALGAGVPAVVYDVGGLASPVRAFGAGRVVPAG